MIEMVMGDQQISGGCFFQLFLDNRGLRRCVYYYTIPGPGTNQDITVRAVRSQTEVFNLNILIFSYKSHFLSSTPYYLILWPPDTVFSVKHLV
ncbi:hypothetical protein ES703_106623 [subsurface metagenome]